jgi:protein gp37
MNRQGPGKIEWTDYTWSPVTGCKHGCSYCYADKIAQRIYKEKFEPTFRSQRLEEPGHLKVPSKIFVSDMGDLWGEWIPDEWILKVWLECVTLPHTFQFLTKNPARYRAWVERSHYAHNLWWGATWDGTRLTADNVEIMRRLPVPREEVKFISFEPLLAPFEGSLGGLDWIIIGELTGKTHTIDEKREILGWAQDLFHQARDLKIPVFFKNWLGTMFPQREFPKVR